MSKRSIGPSRYPVLDLRPTLLHDSVLEFGQPESGRRQSALVSPIAPESALPQEARWGHLQPVGQKQLARRFEL